MELPAAFCESMKKLLGGEYEALLRAYALPPYKGVRANLLKCTAERFEKEFSAPVEKTPFAEEGFYCGEERPGRHPWHHAGVFYVQEPSAMAVVPAMAPEPGMKVLDLCASPGGKSTQIAARLHGKGLLVSNEVVYPRVKTLLSNLERFGVRNAVVTCSDAKTLCGKLAGFFDCVLVDAPCSGEGMFRKEPSAVAEWTPETPAACARRQLMLLESAAEALREDGVLVYSTCTFSPREDEGVVDAFLKRNGGFEMERIEAKFGRDAMPERVGAPDALRLARRIFPMDGGEGHFVARLRKNSPSGPAAAGCFRARCGRDDAAVFQDFYGSQFRSGLYGELHCEGGLVSILPRGIPELSGIRVLRAGVPAGKIIGCRFEPSHALYMAADACDALHCVRLQSDSPELRKFLHGEEITAPDGLENGYAAVMADGFITGFGKCSGGVLKNHYPKGLRNF